jgi:hypothetical protein
MPTMKVMKKVMAMETTTKAKKKPAGMKKKPAAKELAAKKKRALAAKKKLALAAKKKPAAKELAAKKKPALAAKKKPALAAKKKPAAVAPAMRRGVLLPDFSILPVGDSITMEEVVADAAADAEVDLEGGEASANVAIIVPVSWLKRTLLDVCKDFVFSD